MTLRHLSPVVLATGVSLSTAMHADAAVRYVNGPLTSGSGNGTSWANAYRGADALAQAMSASVAGDEIWVAAGTYRPATTGLRTATHTLKNGVGVYGGFAGNESVREQRNPSKLVTIVTGDQLLNDSGAVNLTDNSYHVFVASGAGATSVIDGFTVRGGYANGANASDQDKGGGLLIVGSGSPMVRNCLFVSNRCTFGGGAVYIFNAGGSFADCRFESNVGGSFGGAFDMNAVVGNFDRCAFVGNTAARAGACESYGGSQTRYTNCIFRANSATGANGGGAIWIGTSSVVTARNCTLVANTATTLAGCVINTSGSSSFGNCILWGNSGPGGMTVGNQITNSGGTTLASYCVVQGSYAGTANLAADPLFVNAASGDYRLLAGSTAIDSGSNPLATTGATTDYGGQPRYRDDPTAPNAGTGVSPLIDRGALERQPPCAADVTWDGTVDAQDIAALLSNWGGTGVGDINADGGVDAQDIAALLSAWGPC